MKINNTVFASALLPLAALGFVAVDEVDSATILSSGSTEVTNACPVTVTEVAITQDEEQVFFVGCGGFF